MCDKETIARYRPFCSQRCADLDLGKWLTGAYAIPSHASEDDDSQMQEGAEDKPYDPNSLN